MVQLLEQAASEALDVLDRVSKVCKSRYQCPPMSPGYIQEAKAIILLRSTKAGLGLGMRAGHGLLLARLPALREREPPRWSSPVFLRMIVGQVGLIMGFEQVDSFLLAMTRKVLDQLLVGSHTVMGVDQSFIMLQPEIEDKSDVIAAAAGSTDLVGVSHSSGVMLDFSLTGGSMSVDQAKMREAYGEGVGMAEVVKGIIPPHPDMHPLFARLDEMVVGGRTESIGRTTTSLERMTAGYDPERMRPNSETLLPSSSQEARGGSAGLVPPTIHSAPRLSAGPARVGATPLGGGAVATDTGARAGLPAVQPGAGAPAGMPVMQAGPVKMVPAGQASARVVQREA